MSLAPRKIAASAVAAGVPGGGGDSRGAKTTEGGRERGESSSGTCGGSPNGDWRGETPFGGVRVAAAAIALQLMRDILSQGAI